MRCPEQIDTFVRFIGTFEVMKALLIIFGLAAIVLAFPFNAHGMVVGFLALIAATLNR